MERDHPLALELASLRSQLSKYQHASHQSGIQLQGSRLEQTITHGELALSSARPPVGRALARADRVLRDVGSAEKIKALETDNIRLTAEIEALRYVGRALSGAER